MIPPWSVPFATITGNTTVIKPSQRDPGAAVILAGLVTGTAFPGRVINTTHVNHRAVNFIIDVSAITPISFVRGNSTG